MGERLETTCLLVLCNNISKLSDKLPGGPTNLSDLSLVISSVFIAIFSPGGLTVIYILVIFTKYSITYFIVNCLVLCVSGRHSYYQVSAIKGVFT